MDVNLGEFVTLVGLLIASGVGIVRAVGEILKTKAAGVYTILAGTATALLAVYADRIVIK